MINRNREYVNNLFSSIQALIDETSASAESLYKSAEKTNNEIVIQLFKLLIFTLVISILLAYFITRSITLPLDDIVKNIKEIAKGNLNNYRLKEEKDEIGQLAQSFNLMQENLAEKGSIAERIAQGDFSAHVKPGGENDVVAKSINMIATNFDIVVKQAQKVAAGDFETGIRGIAESNPLSVVISQMLDSLKEVVTKARQVAQGDYSGEIVPKSKSDELAISLNKMTESLRTAINENLKQNRLKTAQNELNEQMRGDLSLEIMAKNIIAYVAKYTNAQIGALYLHSKEDNGYTLKGSYAFHFRKGIHTFFKDGDGLIGQSALEKEIITFSELPDDYVRITSGIGETVPRNIIVAPFVYEGSTIGVIELGAVNEFSDEAYDFLKMVLENIAISVTSANNRTQMAYLLNITSRQAEELQVQQEELKQSNEELESQTQALKRSEEYLQTQQEELKVTNEELEEKTRHLEKQQEQMKLKNQELEQARLNLEKKANELEITNRYKSEFLANMSHELRTPLNSLLILSQSLMENKDNNLNENQLKSAEIIYNSGNDLLNLINDILDLSKIESGKMSISLGTISLTNFTTSIHNYFEQIIKEKGLELKIEIGKDIQEQIVTDEQRLNQILRNLLSNAAKFTEKGGVYFGISKPKPGEDLSRSGLQPSNTIAFSIKDTGIGIPQNKQLEIFEAFQQVDGSISRKYGGTGLGLSITRELVKMLGGEIKLQSEPGKGSEFTVFLPVDATAKLVKSESKKVPVIFQTAYDEKAAAVKTKQAAEPKKHQPRSISDERAAIGSSDPSILIIEDDANFAETLAKICKEKGFFYLSVATGEEGIELARQYLPKGILLDINLPGMNGWDVLDALKNNAETRHIPVHFISGYEETIEAYNKGAIGFLSKPVTKENLVSAIDQIQHLITRQIKDLLLIEDDENLQKSIKTLLEAKDILITECTTARNAIELISTRRYDCIVLDLGLPDMNGFEMLKYLKKNKIKIPPIVVYTGREITPEENDELQYYTQNIIIKGVKSEERLLDETSLFLHRVVDDMPDRQKKMLTNLYDKDQMFRDKKILIVDDDMRNVFAITRLLEESHMQVAMAPNGAKALDILESAHDIDLILMDIMMPVMDGYETMKKIRKNKNWDKIPIIALTAKAMKEDRDKSIDAGANDYLSKPVDIQKLFNLMRIWLYQ
jgi:CheY-like chemotaxis protein/signal transduction histidine kinase